MSVVSQPLPIVVRAQGVTPAERYLRNLCDRSFLSLWSYPSLFRDQKIGGKGDGKELCDVLVVFGDDVLIFSDKDCAFPGTGDVQLDWSRWFRKAVMKSAEQAWGAERWLRDHPDRVFLDRHCSQPFPLELPPLARMRVHHVIVAHNVADLSAAFFGGGSSGTLVFNSDLRGKDHYGDPKQCQPFEVGWLDPARPFVHVLDDASLDILLHNRDTITDFLQYLRWKEELLQSAKDSRVRFFYAGEEDLLANYLMAFEEGRHGFSLPKGYNAVALEEGDWIAFQRSPQRAAQLEADRISYLWDELVEKFNKNILDGTSLPTSSFAIADREKIMRFFAREPRVRRRLLADALMGLIVKGKPTQRTIRVIHPSNPGDPYYCFLLMPHLFGRPREEYRLVRAHALEALCLVTKVVYPEALDIVGFATEPGLDTIDRSEDSLYLNARVWSDELEEHARDLQKKLNLLTNTTEFRDKVAEFPIPDENVVKLGPNPRNKPCPCGSGKKYKRCHGQ